MINDALVCGSGGVWVRVVEVIMFGTSDEMAVERSPEESSSPGWVTDGPAISGLSVETARFVASAKLVLELVTSDNSISVTLGETARGGMAELGCSPMWVANESVECGSEGIRVVEVTRSGTVAEIVVVRTPEVPSLSA